MPPPIIFIFIYIDFHKSGNELIAILVASVAVALRSKNVIHFTYYVLYFCTFTFLYYIVLYSYIFTFYISYIKYISCFHIFIFSTFSICIDYIFVGRKELFNFNRKNFCATISVKFDTTRC